VIRMPRRFSPFCTEERDLLHSLGFCQRVPPSPFTHSSIRPRFYGQFILLRPFLLSKVERGRRLCQEHYLSPTVPPGPARVLPFFPRSHRRLDFFYPSPSIGYEFYLLFRSCSRHFNPSSACSLLPGSYSWLDSPPKTWTSPPLPLLLGGHDEIFLSPAGFHNKPLVSPVSTPRSRMESLYPPASSPFFQLAGFLCVCQIRMSAISLLEMSLNSLMRWQVWHDPRLSLPFCGCDANILGESLSSCDFPIQSRPPNLTDGTLFFFRAFLSSRQHKALRIDLFFQASLLALHGNLHGILFCEFLVMAGGVPMISIPTPCTLHTPRTFLHHFLGKFACPLFSFLL